MSSDPDRQPGHNAVLPSTLGRAPLDLAAKPALWLDRRIGGLRTPDGSERIDTGPDRERVVDTLRLQIGEEHRIAAALLALNTVLLTASGVLNAAGGKALAIVCMGLLIAGQMCGTCALATQTGSRRPGSAPDLCDVRHSTHELMRARAWIIYQAVFVTVGAVLLSVAVSAF